MNDDGSRDGNGADDDRADGDVADLRGDAAPEPESPEGPEAPEPWPMAPPTRRALWPWFLGVFTTILVVASVVASFVQLPYYTIAPGDALDVNGLVTVHGARQYPAKGSVMLLFVRERSRINAWRWIQASLDSEIDLVKEKQFAGNADPAELDAQAVADMANSQNAAKYVALRELGYKVTVENEVSVLSVIRGRPAAGVLQPGDIFASIDGAKIATADQLTNAMKGRKPGQSVSIGYVRGGRHRTARLRFAADAQGHPVIGVYLGRPLKFPIDVRIDTSDIGGPSAGLAMTLSILDELTPGNLTGAKQIAVTGAIGFDGSVQEVGGVGQKAVAARHRGAKLFIVPIQEVAEARTRAGSMPVVGVRTLADALRALRAAGGDPLPVVHSRAAA